MTKRPKLPKAQQASIPRPSKLDGKMLKSRVEKESLRDLILPPDLNYLSYAKETAFGLVPEGMNILLASGDKDAVSTENDTRRFFAINTKTGGHVGFQIEGGSFNLDVDDAAAEGARMHTVIEQVMGMARGHWGPGVELEVVEMPSHAGYQIRPRHNYVQDQIGEPGSKDPETAKIIGIVQETMTAFAKQHGHYPTIRQIYYEMVNADQWMNSEENYLYLADIITKARKTQRQFDRSEPSMRYNPPDERLTPFDIETPKAAPGVNHQLEAYAAGMNEVGRKTIHSMIYGTADRDRALPAITPTCPIVETQEEADAILRNGGGVGIDMAKLRASGEPIMGHGGGLGGEHTGGATRSMFGGGSGGGKTARLHGTVTGRWTQEMAREESARRRREEGPQNAPFLYPYQQEMMERIMSDVPFEMNWPSSMDEFKARYAARPQGPTYRGTMSDYLRQGGASMADALSRFYGRKSQNHIDDVFNRRQRRAEQLVQEYCWADVLFTADYAAIELRTLFTMLDGYPTVPVTHRLTSGYGHESGQGTNITIVYTGASPWPTREHANMIAGAFVGYGCAPVYARKAGDSIYGCGEYSCDVTLSRHALENLKNTMEVLDCKVFIRRPAARYKADTVTDIR